MSASPRPPQGPPEERLESWKEIAAYLGKGVRTVVRWEKTEGLPVHRHLHERRSSVFCYKSEIDAWWHNRRADLEEPPGPGAPPTRRMSVAAGIAGVAVLAAVTGWLLHARLERTPETPLKAEPLTAYAGDQNSLNFSPDGSHFAFVWNGPKQDNFDLWIQAVGGSERKRLTENPWLDFSPAWSPDGNGLPSCAVRLSRTWRCFCCRPWAVLNAR